MELEGADGIERVFHFDGEDWRLSTVRDAFGNSLDVTYEGDLWTLTDTVGRTQRVYWTTVADRQVVARVELTAFGTSSPAVYSFSYANAPEGLDIDESCVDARLGHEMLRVPLLTALTLPDGSDYRMVDWLGEPAYHVTNGSGNTKAGGPGPGSSAARPHRRRRRWIPSTTGASHSRECSTAWSFPRGRCTSGPTVRCGTPTGAGAAPPNGTRTSTPCCPPRQG